MQRILITGTNRGLGLELVHQYLRRGDTRIFATARKPDDAIELGAFAAVHSERLTLLPLDVSDDSQIAAAAQTVMAELDGLDILINNAGVNPSGGIQTLDTISTQTMMSVFQVNAVAPLNIAKAFLPLLKAGNNPRIVNVSTQQGSMQWKTSGGSYAYAVSKAGLNMVTRCLAADLRQHNIITVTLHPGWVRTDMGGSHATLTAEESATGILNLIDNLTAADNGSFFRWNGEAHPW